MVFVVQFLVMAHKVRGLLQHCLMILTEYIVVSEKIMKTSTVGKKRA